MRLTARGPAEFELVKELHDATFSGVERATDAALQWTFDHGDVFVTDVSERHFLAFAIVSTVNGQPFLRAIATDPRYRGEGIGGRLLDEIIAYYQGRYEYIDLTCRADNPAQKLYFDKGWRVTQVLRNYYGEGISGLRMRRTL